MADTSRERAVRAAHYYDFGRDRPRVWERGTSAQVIAASMIAKALIYVGDQLGKRAK